MAAPLSIRFRHAVARAAPVSPAQIEALADELRELQNRAGGWDDYHKSHPVERLAVELCDSIRGMTSDAKAKLLACIAEDRPKDICRYAGEG